MSSNARTQIALDMRAAAAALCMSYSAFRRLYYAETKVLPAGTKIGGKVLFAVADLAAIFETPAAETEPAQEQLKRGRGRPRKVAQVSDGHRK